MDEKLFNRKRKILKKEIDITNRIETLNKEQNALSGKGDLSAALKIKDEIKDLKRELKSINKEIDEINFLKNFNYLQEEFLKNLSDEEKSTVLYFEKEDCIPITSKITDTFDSLENNNSKILSIGRSLSTSLSDSESKFLIRKIFTNYENNINNSPCISMCYIQFKDYFAPLLFIPVIVENPYDYKILRDVNKDIVYNVILKNELKQFDINLPEFNESIGLFMYNLKKIDKINFKSNIILSNCNIERISLFQDFDLDSYELWDSFSSKLNSIIVSNNKGCFSQNEMKKINNDIAEIWPNLNLKLNDDEIKNNQDILIKNLLSEGNSILYVSNDSQSVKNSLINSNIGPLILDLNENITIDSFKNQINEKLIKTFDNLEKLNYSYEKDNLKRIIPILKYPYLNFNILPMEIKEKIKFYSNQIKGQKIRIPIDNIQNYSIGYFDSVNKDILYLIRKYHEIEDFKKYFYSESFKSYNDKEICIYLNNLDNFIDEFISLNKLLNKNLNLKLFENLSSVKFLTNLNVLTKKYQYIDVEDRVILNDFIKNYEEKEYDQYINNIESLINFNKNLLNFKPKLLKFNENLCDLINFLNEKNPNYSKNNLNLMESGIDLNKTIGYLNDLDSYLNILNTININQIKNDIGSFDNKYNEIYDKYFNSNENIYEILENNIKYTELIDYGIITDELIIKRNLLSMSPKIEYIYQVYKNILKEINNIKNFNQKNLNFKIPDELFDKNISFRDLKNIIHNIKNDIMLFNALSYKNYNSHVNEYIELYLDNRVDEQDISNMLYLNVYESLFSCFSDEYPELSNKNLDYKYYELKLNNISKNMWEYQYNNFMHNIYKKPRHLTNSKINENNKILLNEEIDNKQIKTIKEALNAYKDCIMANKRIFMLDSMFVMKYLGHVYENTFDYVIVDDINSLSDFELFSLLLRSKNNLMYVK